MPTPLMRVAQMLSAILGALDAEIRIDPATSNGDVFQAVAMALAIRASMIEARGDRNSDDRALLQ